MEYIYVKREVIDENEFGTHPITDTLNGESFSVSEDKKKETNLKNIETGCIYVKEEVNDEYETHPVTDVDGGGNVKEEIDYEDKFETDPKREIIDEEGTTKKEEIPLLEVHTQNLEPVIKIEEGGKVFNLGVIDIPAFYIDFDARARGDKNYRITTRDVRNLLDELVNKDKVSDHLNAIGGLFSQDNVVGLGWSEEKGCFYPISVLK